MVWYRLGAATPLSDSWVIIMLWLYIARTPNIDCYWVGAVPKVQGLGCRVDLAGGGLSKYIPTPPMSHAKSPAIPSINTPAKL